MTRNDTLLFGLLLGTLLALGLISLPLLFDEGEVPEPLVDEHPIGKINSPGELPPPDAPVLAEVGAEARRDVAVGPAIAARSRRPKARTLRGVVLHALTGQPLQGLHFTVTVARPWTESERTTVLQTDSDGRFELTRCVPGSRLTFAETSIPELRGELELELEPRTVRVDDAGELVLHAHPPALALHLSARGPDGGVVSRPEFWIQTETSSASGHQPQRTRLEGNLDTGRGVLTATFLPSLLSSGFLLVGIEDRQIPREEWTGSENDTPRVIWGELTELRGELTRKDLEWIDAREIRSRPHEDAGHLVAGPVQVADWRGEHHHVFELEPGAGLQVRVLDAEGKSAEGVRMLIDGDTWRDRWPSRRNAYHGVQSFEPLKPGPYDVVVLDSFVPTVELARESVTVNSDETTELVIELPAERRRRLAVSGTLVSASGTPMPKINVRVELAGEGGRTVSTSSDGRFEVWTHSTASQLTVRPDGDLWAGPFEPAFVECPFGAADLRFTRAEARAARFRLYFTDERTGRAIRGFRHVTLYLDGAASNRPSSPFVLSNEPYDEPFVSAPYTPRDDLRWIARVPHYRSTSGSIPAPAQLGEIVELTARLRPGYEEELRVVAASSGAPIAGAAVLDGRGRELGRTDPGGGVTLLADEWPGELRVEAVGFHPATWRLDRKGLTAHWAGEVRLRPR